MQIRLNNSKLILLIPRHYSRVENGAELYSEMYHKREATDVEMFQEVASESYGNVVVAHINPSDALTFNKDTLIKTIHDTLEDNQGLIEVEAGTNPRGYEYIYSIIKTYHEDDLNVNYCVHMNIKNGDEMIEICGSFFETRMTGIRSAMGWNMAMSAGLEIEEGSPSRIKGWVQDPYDPEYKKGCRMILCEKRGLDGMFPADPLSQARELVLALTEDSYYKTRKEIEADDKAEKEKEAKEEKRNRKATGKNKSDDEKKTPDESEENITDSENKDDAKETFKMMFTTDKYVRANAFKVEIVENEEEKQDKKFNFKSIDIAKTAARAADGFKTAIEKTSAEMDKVKTPFDIPDDFRCRLNQPMPKELPGWGRRAYIGFGKSTFAMDGICMSWPVTETESLPLSDTKRVIEQIHNDMDDHQGLIMAKCGITPKGNRYAYTIRKLQLVDEKGEPQRPTYYDLSFNIRINGKVHFINSSFQPKDDAPGDRTGCLGIMQLGSSELKLTAEEWVGDPYDPERKKGFLMNWEEDEKYDGLFPYHPLSEMRRFVKYVIANN